MSSRTFREKRFKWKVKLISTTVLYSPNVYSIRGCEWKIIGKYESSLKNKSQSHFLEEIFRPVDSNSLTL